MVKRKERKLPPVGNTYTRKYKGKTYTMKVVRKNGRIAFSVLGKEFNSPSGAAKTIAKTEVNGWVFWKV